jgi:phage terminase small subunit
MAELKEKQRRFCEEYLKDLNGTQAAIRAGYSPKTANEQSSRLLANVNIQSYIQSRQKQLQEATGITQERVLQEYARIAFCDIRGFYNEDGSLKPITDLTEEQAAALAGVDVDEIWEGYGEEREQTGITKKIKRWDKVKALDSLGRHLGMFGKDNEQSKPVVNITGMKVT